MDSQTLEVLSPSGEQFTLSLVPAGTPVRADPLPGTGIIDNLMWAGYVWLREATARRWKVAVIRQRAWVDSGEVVHSRKVSAGEAPQALAELAARCEAGDFDDTPDPIA